MDSNHRSLATSRGSRLVIPRYDAAGSISLWAKPHPWRRATARRFFWLTGLRRVFRRGTNGSNPSPSSGESRANRANPDTAAATGALGLKNVKHIQGSPAQR